jgi:hemerythrin-like domain-containing protein
LSKAGESDGIEGVIRQYLGQSHRDKAEKGCAFAALTQEIARQDKGTRTILEDELEAYIDVIARHIDGTDKNAGQTKALQIFRSEHFSWLVPCPMRTTPIIF